MSHFDADFLQFYKDLAANNNRDWFHENKKRYEKSVKEPLKAFVAEMILRAREEDPGITMEAKDAIFRINRDVRFSKDKSPYKTGASALISRGGKKDHSTPGLYIELNPEHIRLYSGAHMLEKETLLGVREHIAANLKQFQKLASDPKFVSAFGEIRGEKNKRLPKELVEAAATEPLIFNKNFYWYAQLPAKEATNSELPEMLMERYAACRPLRNFLLEGMGQAV